MALSERRQRFVEEYLIDLNASAAYRRAGYKPKDEASARASAARLLANVSVSAEVAERRRRQTTMADLTVSEVVSGLRREAAFTGEGSSHGARVAALSWLGKYLAMFVDRHEHTFPDDAADQALAARLGRLAAGRAGPSVDANGAGTTSPTPALNGRNGAGPVAGGPAQPPS